jgi:hypothetical protein
LYGIPATVDFLSPAGSTSAQRKMVFGQKVLSARPLVLLRPHRGVGRPACHGDAAERHALMPRPNSRAFLAVMVRGDAHPGDSDDSRPY